MRLFVTVGNALDPFDRMLQMVDQALATFDGEFAGLCQHGPSSIRPRGIEQRDFISRNEFDSEMVRADIVVIQAGVGSLEAAIRHGHTPLVVPRRLAFREMVNDHQLQIAEELKRSGAIHLVSSAEELVGWLRRWQRGEFRRGSERTLELARLTGLVSVFQEVKIRQPSAFRRALLRAIAFLGPPLDDLRLTREPP